MHMLRPNMVTNNITNYYVHFYNNDRQMKRKLYEGLGK